nr:aspartate/glutamate racemase family protein [Clostridium pasteurianum]
MKKIGMIGGLGPESTLDYYRLIIEKYRNEVKDGSYPEILINSMDMNILLSFVENKQWDNLVNCLIKGVEILYKAGADFGFISSNTPHIVFERIKELSPIPLISIVEETCKNAEALGIKRLA